MHRKSLFSLILPSVSLVLFSIPAQSHGWPEYPAARQAICYDQGGLWHGTPPNAACAQAKNISGTYPFVQRNEYSINVTDFNNIEAIKNAIPDGTLCYANDSQKKGMGAAHDGWTRSEVTAGTFEYIFKATAQHNPSFWKFYLTKPGADLSKALSWGDLDLIQEEGNNVAVNGKYRMNVTIPTDRVGDAILFVRWQRIDPAGEGFYNCSDITIVNDDVTLPPVDPDPGMKVPYLVQGGAFIPEDVNLDSVSAGDTVNYEVLNKNGVVHSSFSIDITTDNRNDWDRLLASKINGWYESNHDGNVFIGAWHEEMKHYMYFQNDLRSNYFNSKDSRASEIFSVTTTDESIQAVISPKVLTALNDASVEHGESVVLTHNESKGDITDIQWTQISGRVVDTTVGSNNELIINTESLPNTRQELTFKLVVTSDNVADEEVYSFVVESVDPVDPIDPVEPVDPTLWNASETYVAKDTVTYNGKTWTAQWWTRGEIPGTTGEWGVWR